MGRDGKQNHSMAPPGWSEPDWAGWRSARATPWHYGRSGRSGGGTSPRFAPHLRVVRPKVASRTITDRGAEWRSGSASAGASSASILEGCDAPTMRRSSQISTTRRRAPRSGFDVDLLVADLREHLQHRGVASSVLWIARVRCEARYSDRWRLPAWNDVRDREHVRRHLGRERDFWDCLITDMTEDLDRFWREHQPRNDDAAAREDRELHERVPAERHERMIAQQRRQMVGDGPVGSDAGGGRLDPVALFFGDLRGLFGGVPQPFRTYWFSGGFSGVIALLVAAIVRTE